MFIVSTKPACITYIKLLMDVFRTRLSGKNLGWNFSFLSHRLLFSHASAEVRDENTPERKVASTGDRTGHESDTLTTKPPGRGQRMSDSFYHITESSELNWKVRDQNILNWPCRSVIFCVGIHMCFDL